jgi:hypothetical protein
MTPMIGVGRVVGASPSSGGNKVGARESNQDGVCRVAEAKRVVGPSVVSGLEGGGGSSGGFFGGLVGKRMLSGGFGGGQALLSPGLRRQFATLWIACMKSMKAKILLGGTLLALTWLSVLTQLAKQCL